MSYKYLGRLITATDDDIPEVIDNLQKAQNIWSRLLMILVHEGTDAWASVFFYLAIVQAVLLFCADTRLMTLRIGWMLGGSATGWRRGYLGNNPVIGRMVPGNIPHWRRLCGW